MKNRIEACLLAVFTASMLSGCFQSCYKSTDIVLSQVSIGDASAPEIAITKFPVVPTNRAAGCQSTSLVRVELYIDTNGYVRGMNFMDPWPNECANAYVRYMESARIVDVPLERPLEHFRVDIHNDVIQNKQCLRIQ